MEENELETFDETIRRGRNRSIKAQLLTDDDDDDDDDNDDDIECFVLEFHAKITVLKAFKYIVPLPHELLLVRICVFRLLFTHIFADCETLFHVSVL
jgi:hypothetical protein